MYEMTAGAEEERVPQSRFTLSSVLLVAAALAFVTALIVISGESSPAWFLYLLPIVIGALAYDIGGGVIVTALSAAAVFLAAPPTALSAGWPEFLAGFAVFLMCGVVIGWQAHRQRTHRVALERASALDALTGVLKAEDFVSELVGHYKSESMLRHLCDVIRLTVRATDTIGRLEPTTFAVALPHADAARAAAVAERLITTTRAAEFEGDALEPITACVTTASSASYPADAVDQIELLQQVKSRLGERRAAEHDASEKNAAVS
jgi:K+-sensing histidine kinase KdpD